MLRSCLVVMSQHVVPRKELSILATSANLKVLQTNRSQGGAGMDVHKNARSLPASRALLIDRVERQGWSLTAAARAAGMSVRRSREWRRRGRAKEPLDDRSSRPNTQPNRISDDERTRIIELRRSRMTMRQIAKYTTRSVATVARVCRDAALGRLHLLEPMPPDNRYEHPAAGDMVHLDTKRLGRIENGPGHRITGNRRGRVAAG